MEKTWAAVAAGGFLGACARYGIKQIGIQAGGVPVEILLINLAGAFCLAFFLEVTLDRLEVSRAVRLGVSTGFLGAFTTFSTLCQEAEGLYRWSGAAGTLYLTVSVLGGLLAAWLGLILARRLVLPGREASS